MFAFRAKASVRCLGIAGVLILMSMVMSGISTSAAALPPHTVSLGHPPSAGTGSLHQQAGKKFDANKFTVSTHDRVRPHVQPQINKAAPAFTATTPKSSGVWDILSGISTRLNRIKFGITSFLGNVWAGLGSGKGNYCT